MKKLLAKITTTENFNNFCKLLMVRMENNIPISTAPTLDGMAIGFILSTDMAQDLFLQRDISCVLYSVGQKLDSIRIWCTINEDTLCELFDTK